MHLKLCLDTATHNQRLNLYRRPYQIYKGKDDVAVKLKHKIYRLAKTIVRLHFHEKNILLAKRNINTSAVRTSYGFTTSFQ